MKRYKFLPIFLFSLVLFLISFILGYSIIGKKIEESRISQLDNRVDVEKNNDFEILKEDVKISPNTVIEERVYYSDCEHVISKMSFADSEYINFTRDELVDYLNKEYPDRRLISFSANKVTIGVTKKHLCENHFIIGEKDGKIAIYKIDENGEKVVDTVFEDYPISLLMDVDQDKLREGIRVDSEEELSEILENFIS
ncbi:MAG TPA: BofC C-terminal domain-containing protein [Tissierellaceae bacterium]